MRIAFVSYEYPPDTADGGIATYVRQAARGMHGRGHSVEVFAGSRQRTAVVIEEGIQVHRVQVENPQDFAAQIAPVFARRHAQAGFDVLEGPDYNADARYIVRLVPEIPLVIKLHSPLFLAGWIQASLNRPTLRQKLRTRLRAAIGRPGPANSWRYDRNSDVEYLHTHDADEIAAPSEVIRDRLIQEWELDPARVARVPLPYVPSREFLSVPVETQTGVVSYIGKLQILKGVADLTLAIPMILRHHPNARFRFVGPVLPSPEAGMDMQQYLTRSLGPFGKAVEFVGPVALDDIPGVLAAADISVCPSLWESFGLVCLEAMSAGRGVVASRVGDMARMLDYGAAGRVIPPRNPRSIANAVSELLGNPDLRMKLGKAARARVLSEYNVEKTAAVQEESYQRAIERRRLSGPRQPDTLPGEGVH